MADQLPGRRNVSSLASETLQPFETVIFDHSPLWRDKQFLTQKYVVEGRSITQIAAENFSSRAAVWAALVEFGIKRKGQGKPGLRPSQLPYGYRRSDGLMVPHLGEQRIISLVKKLTLEGMSYRRVCEFLSSAGVPTKRHGQRWQPEMIRRMINRKPT